MNCSDVVHLYYAARDLPELRARAGDFVAVVPGAGAGEADIIVFRPIDRGRLGHVMRYHAQGVLPVVGMHPPVSSDHPVEALQALVLSGGSAELAPPPEVPPEFRPLG